MLPKVPPDIVFYFYALPVQSYLIHFVFSFQSEFKLEELHTGTCKMTIKKTSISRCYKSTFHSLSAYTGLLGLSLALAGCSGSDPGVVLGEIPIMSDNDTVQNAYERCVRETQEELVKDNPGTSDDILTIMYSGALQTCESAVVITCDKGLETDSCKIILDIYKS